MRMKVWIAAVSAFLLVVTAMAVGAAVVLHGDGPDPRPSPPAPEFAVQQPQLPTLEEITIGVSVTGQQCSPDGMCVYTYTIEPKYIGFHPLPDEPFTVTYQVSGGHQPQTGDFTVHSDGQTLLPDGVTVEGPAGAQLQATVTDIVPDVVADQLP